MVYGVIRVHNTENYNDVIIQVWRGSNANLLFNKGCMAVFLEEQDAITYAEDKAKLEDTRFNKEMIDIF